MYKFTDSEKQEMGLLLAESMNDLEQLQIAKKTAISEHNDKIGAKRDDMKQLRNSLRSGQETRTIYCRVEYNPDKRVKKYYDTENEEFIKEEAMTKADFDRLNPSLF